jgi:hypothetical protein
LKKYIFWFVFTCFLLPISSQAQIYQYQEDHVKEFIYGVNINTNGGLIGGVFLKGNKIIKPKTYRSWGLEIVGVKHKKEIKLQGANGSTFVPGKLNHLIVIRPQYGRDYLIFRKAPEEGVQVSLSWATGPSIGWLIPYHIIYREQDKDVSVAFDPAVHVAYNNILGSGTIFEGIGESKFTFGAHAKAGISLDFSAFRNSITGIELGVNVEGFIEEPKIMTNPPSISVVGQEVKNHQLFASLYLNFFFGMRK